MHSEKTKPSIKTKLLGVVTALIGLGPTANATDISVIDVRRNIPLSDSDPIYKDFYIDAGIDQGIKKDQVLTVYRRTLVKDATGLKSFGEFEIPVGQLKVIALNNRVAVAREVKLISRDNEAMLEQIGIMTGDRIQLGK